MLTRGAVGPLLAGAIRVVATAILAGITTFVGQALAADPVFDGMTVRWRDDVVSTHAATLSADQLAAFAGAVAVPFSLVGRTVDGAFRVELTVPLPADAARATVNRVRMLDSVLYANLTTSASSATRQIALANIAAAGPAVQQMIVKYRDFATTFAAARNQPLSADQLDTLSASAGQSVTWMRAMSGGAHVIRLSQPLPANQAESLGQYLAASDTSIEYAEPDLIKRPTLVPNDTFYSLQWHYQSPPGQPAGVNLPPAWDITTGSSQIFVGVLDTGILPHPDLVGRYTGGYDMISEPSVANDSQPSSCTSPGSSCSRDSDPSDPGDWITSNDAAGLTYGGFFHGCPVGDSSWHGTHVAGTIGAASNNGAGVAGVNWISEIIPVRVLGKCGGFDSDIIDAIVWAVGGAVPGVPANPNPVRVINMSFGGTSSCSTSFQAAITTALNAGAVLAVAAGNDNVDALNFSPANCNGVIAVAALARSGARASYSNFGPTVDIAAPGGGGTDGTDYVLSTLNSGATTPAGYVYAYYAGTSMATPHVSGIASLMLSVNPALTPAQVLATIQSTARPFPVLSGGCSTSGTTSCGAGIIDAYAAVLAAQSQGRTTSTTALTSMPNPSTVGQSVTFTATVTGNSPTGTVGFTDNGSPIASCTTQGVSAANATCTTTVLAVGSHSVVATYSGDTNNTGSTSTTLTQAVNKAATSTTLTASPNPSTFGASVTFTATVSVGAATGTVSFTNGGSAISGCTAQTVSASKATCATAALTVGSHSIVATYSGDANYNGSTSTTLTQTVNKPATSTALASSANPSAPGASVTFTATITGNAPTGTVGFTSDGSAISGCTAQAVSAGKATCATAALTVGSHSIVATYSGDAGNAGSVSPALVQGVGKTASTTTLASSPNPSTSGVSVTITATVAGSTPTGTVGFTSDGGAITGCATQAISAGKATCTTAALAVGSHSIVATYGGDANNAGSTSATLIQTVNSGSAPAALVNASFEVPALISGKKYLYAPTGAGVGWSFNATAGVQHNGSSWGAQPAPDGTQTAFIQMTGTITQTVTLNAGGYTLAFQAAQRACCAAPNMQPIRVSVDGVQIGSLVTPPSTSFTAFNIPFSVAITGAHTITFAGTDASADRSAFIDAVSLSSSSSTSPTTTMVASSLNPSTFGSGVTFTATITGNAPTGTVGFTSDGSAISGCTTQAVSAGMANCATAALTAGSHNIVATYGGDINNSGSTSPTLTQTVNKTATSTTLASSLNPSAFGASVTFTATITGNATGGVGFTSDGGAISGCTAQTVSAGKATCTTSALTVGSHSIVATYSGDANNNGSTSPTFTQTVNSGSAPAALVNASFEVPALTKYQYAPTGPGVGWSFNATAGVQHNGSSWGAQPAPDGTQTAFIQMTGTITQTVTLNAGSYTLAFQAARRPCCAAPNVQPIRVSVDGVQIGSLVSAPSTSFTAFSIPFSVPTTGAHTITFAGTDASADRSAFIDAVSLF